VLRAGVGLSTDRDSARAAAEAASGALRSAGVGAASVVLVFATTPHGPGFGRVTRTVAELAGTRNVVGCSAAGVVAEEQEIETGAAVSVLALAGGVDVRRFFVPVSRGSSATAAADGIAEALGDAPVDDGLLLLFADTYNVEADALLATLAHRLPGVAIVGGGASEDGSVGEVSVFSGDASSSHAVAGVLLRGVRATVGVAHALGRVGPVRRITRCRGNTILALDGEAALAAFRAVVPEALLADPQRALAVVLVGLGDGEDGFVARHIVGMDPARDALAVAGAVHEGQQVFFGVRDPGGARGELERVVGEQAAAWPHAPAAALYVDCIGRGRRFYGVSGLDTAYIRQRFGSLPVAGFFSSAEFAPGPGAARLHQYTGVLTVLGSAA
jgi:small ligand-binding sensory domain FIST